MPRYAFPGSFRASSIVLLAGWLSTAACAASETGADARVGSGAAAAPAAAAPADDALYRDLGGQAGLVALVDDFMLRLLDDPRMRPFFVDIDQPAFKKALVVQFCELSGGPCRREGKDMRTVHAGQDVTRADFNALVEVLQRSLDARGVPFRTQNRLLALLAPMHREIVNAR